MIGNKVCFFETLPSTNSYMKTHQKEYRDGDIIVARMQTAGRGRRERKWISQAGNLHASLLLDGSSARRLPFEIVMKTSLAVVDALATFDVLATIKYPNDIVVGRHKIAGILIENIDNTYIVGVGINVTFNDVDGYAFHPSSILLETSRLVDYRDVLSAFIRSFNALDQMDRESLLKRYKSKSIVIGQTILKEKKNVVVQDITSKGELVVDDPANNRLSPSEVTLASWYDEPPR